MRKLLGGAHYVAFFLCRSTLNVIQCLSNDVGFRTYNIRFAACLHDDTRAYLTQLGPVDIDTHLEHKVFSDYLSITIFILFN